MISRFGRLAQLARALPLHGRCHRFESCSAHCLLLRVLIFESFPSFYLDCFEQNHAPDFYPTFSYCLMRVRYGCMLEYREGRSDTCSQAICSTAHSIGCGSNYARNGCKRNNCHGISARCGSWLWICGWIKRNWKPNSSCRSSTIHIAGNDALRRWRDLWKFASSQS